ncbi:hypothetical protein AMEX_G26857 [Astyanax mexicanus]|uniref:Ig-like domain-containing protein n=1 Tax=Astyanax mexicanus TaxID=7994 RepID=A0A8T2KSA3_ASTMX|nr:hypothetical protein AMEX_G26857 [Astyanax mexicanus]
MAVGPYPCQYTFPYPFPTRALDSTSESGSAPRLHRSNQNPAESISSIPAIVESIMKKGLLIILLVYLSEVQPQKITYINAEVNKPVHLPCELNCYGLAKWTSLYPIKEDVADCNIKPCRIKDPLRISFPFQGDRTTGNNLLFINPVIYNDKGSYRCSCDGKKADVKLNVFVPMVVKAHEREKVSLPCYGDTRRDARDVQWKKETQLVLLYNHENGHVTRGKGFEDGFWVSSEAFKNGDLSLHISSVRQSDAGLYVCTIHGESTDGEPRAVLLIVEESGGLGGLGVLSILLALISGALGAFIIWLWRKKIISWQVIKGLYRRKAHREHDPVQEENPLAHLPKSTTTPFVQGPEE